MICVSIGRGRHKHMLAEYRHLVEQGAKLIELRLDYINGEINLKRLLKDRPAPVLITCRRESDGGRWIGSETDRLMLLRSAVAEGVEYVDLEEDVAGGIPRFGKTKRVISYHNFRSTPDDLPELHARMAALDADIVKVATMANSPHDNVRVLELIQSSQIPTVALCMGDMGTPSRILAARYGAPFTYATFHHERALAPGQLSFRQMTDIYHYEQINGDTEVFGVIADPVGHSYSPLIHNKAFQSLKMNRMYCPFRVPSEDLKQFLADCPRLGVRGLSVTIPHKESVIPYVTKIDRAASGIGAVNTLVFKDGDVYGYNTDYRAAMNSLDRVVGGTSGEQPLKGRTALVLGAGGAAKAIVFGLTRRGADVVIAGRTRERANRLAEALGARAVDWEGRTSVKADVLVNCTPVGMHPNVDETPFDKHYLRPSTIVFDTVYNPEQTLLIKQARDQSCRVVTGVDMFVGQAALQFKLFTGEDPPLDVMRQELKQATGAVRS